MQKTLTYIDINTRAQVYADGAFVTKSSDYINIERGQWQILCIQFGERQMDEAGAVTFTPISFAADTSFVFVADNNFDDDDYLMAKSLQSVIPFDEADPTSNMFNIEGDWVDGGTADFSSGQLSIRINSDTVKFKEVTTDKVSINTGVYINVKQYMQGLSNPSTIAWIPFIAKNTIRDWSSAQVVPPTGTEAIAFINSYFRNPLERQWSEDGITWFDSQSEDHDNYYRERIANIGADWSSGYAVARGFTYTPSVSSDGVISWVNDGDLPNPTPINIKGDKGDNFTVNATGLLSERSQYDAEEKGFSFLATDDGNLYIKNSDTSGDWSGPIPFQGPKGDDGPAGPAGPANTLSIGTVATGEPGTEAAATITGTAPNQTLNLTIPRGSDGTDGADGADGVSSYTYVAYASDASGAGFSLVPSNTLKFRAEIHTTTAIEAPDAEDFAGAAWVKYIGDDGSGAVKSVNGQLPDESGNVTIETGSTVDESRLLPENPANGDIPCYDATVDRGNNADTKLLLQPATSDNEIIDQGKGNTVPLVLNVGANVTVNEAGQIVFTSPNSSFQEAGVIMLSKEQAAQLVTGNNEWCVDLVINVGEYVGQQTVMTLGGGGEYTGNADYACFIMSTARGTFWHWNGTEINMNLLPGNTVLVTVEQWIDDTGAWKLSYYANGSHVFTSSGEHRLSAAVQPLVFGGGYGKSSYFRNTVDAIRFRTVAPYRGQSFTPEARPWLPPAGSWQKVNLAELAKTIIADPVTEMAVADETWGDCRYLDTTFQQLSFRGRVRSLRRVSLETVSIDSGVTGNIVLVPIVNGSELSGTSFVVAVGAAPAVAEFALEVASGTLALRRDTDDERDTLKDSGNTPVTAVVLSVILEVQYDA